MSEKVICEWARKTEIEREYHDHDWGVPVHDERKHFEMLILEGMQAGLSWLCVLKKREAFREAFDGFDVQKVAAYDEKKWEELAQNEGIIRNRLKIKAASTNAKAFIRVQQEFGSFDKYIWGFVDGKPIQHAIKSVEDYQATSELSDMISKDLKKRGFTFVGSTIVYAHMQSIGMVNDHQVDCYRYNEIKNMSKS